MYGILIIAILGIVLAAVFASGCTQQTTTETTTTITPTPVPVPATRNVTDMAGRTVTLPTQVNDVVVLFGPGYEKVAMLGAEDRIVLAADYHKTHAAWAHVIYKRLDTVPAASNPSTPNVEDLLKYNPDVVFWFSNDGNAAKMANAGIPVICSVGNSTKIESLKDLLSVYGQVLGGDAEKRAQEYSTYFDQKLAYVTGITSTIQDSQKPTVYVTSGIPLRTRGGNSVMRDTVEKAGGIYVAKDAPQGTQVVSYEQVNQWNPDIIIIDHAPDLPDPSASATSNTSTASQIYDQIMSDPNLQGVNAVKNHQVYVSPQGAFFWDAGEQGILQLMWMAKLFHPEKFQSLDLNQELKTFYAKFFNYDLTEDQVNLIMKHQLPPGAEKWGYK